MIRLPKIPEFFKSRKLDIIQRMKMRQITTITGIVVILAFFAVAIATNMFNGGQKTEAAITVSGDTVTITGGNYSVDASGNIYSDPGLQLYNQLAPNSLMDPSYLSYLYEPANVTLSAQSSLVLRNNAVLVVEKELNVKNLTIGTNSKVTSPPVDVSGLINHPLYDRNHWAMRLTGYLRMQPQSIYYLHAGNTDDSMFIESSLATNAYTNPSWQPAFSYQTITGWGANLNENSTDFKAYVGSGPQSGLLSNLTDEVKYVPIRVSLAEYEGSTAMKLLAEVFNPDGSQKIADQRMPRNWVYGINEDGTVNSSSSGVSKADFEYFLTVRQNTGTARLPSRSLPLSDAVKTIDKRNINLLTAFANGFGQLPGYETVMEFYWEERNNYSTPVANTLARYEGRYNSTKTSSLENTNVIDYSRLRRLSGGIEINATDSINISSDAIGIDVSNKGYPGYHFVDTKPMNRGASLNVGGIIGFPGGGYTVEGNNWVGSAGSHAGIGGSFMSGTIPSTRALQSVNYGNSFDPRTLGSGGGGSSEENKNFCHISNGGNGGGAVAISTGTLTISRNSSISAINANGGAGERNNNPNGCYYWVGTGGAGGSINIATQSLSLTSPNADLFSARGATYSDVPLNNYSLGWGSVNNYKNFSGGGGGYVYIRFNRSTSNFSPQQVINFSNVSGGSGSPDAPDNLGFAQGGSGVTDIDAEASTALSIRKELTPLQRNGVSNTTFNPYALRPDDKIKVTLKIQDVVAGTVIEDEILRQQGVSGGFYCNPDTATINPAGNVSDPPNLVSWAVITAVPGVSEYSYECQVRK